MTMACLLLMSVMAYGQQASTNRVITKDDLAKIGTSIPVTSIGELVGSVKLYEPRWVEASGEMPAYGVIEGSIMPVDPKGWPINFRVLLPSSWSLRSLQRGGGGMNGSITVNAGKDPLLAKGFVLYGSDSGHQAGGGMGGMMGGFGGMGGGAPAQAGPTLPTGPSGGDDWALNDEAIKNMGYMQMKKTHDATMVILERLYGKRPQYNYFVGTSHGGLEAVTVAQRYPKDYNGIIANVPILNFSTLMLAPELIRIQEKPLPKWVTPAKVNAVRAEFLRQCDKLDGLADGVINNYMASREIFNVNDGKGPKDPWAALRAPNNVDPDPTDKSVNAKLTNEQIKSMEMMYSNYMFATPLANGVKSFGMWLPNTQPDGMGLIERQRYKGQEGAAENASTHSQMGIVGVTGFLFKDLKANPLDYVEGGKLNARRLQLSKWLDSTDPNLTAFYKNGGKMIVTIGAMDNIACPGAQLDYFASVLKLMGRKTVDSFARLFVVPTGGHGLSGQGYSVNGEGKTVTPISQSGPSGDDNMQLLMNWVEKGQAPAKTLVITKGRISTDKNVEGYILCSYPNYAKYVSGPANMASSYVSTAP